MYKNPVPAPLLYKYYICLHLCLAAELDNGVLNLTTWCTSLLGAPCTIFRCLESCPPPVSLSLIRLPHFLAAVTSLNQSFLSFPGRPHRLFHRWLKRCLSFGRRPLLPIPICNLILDFKIINSLCNKPSSPLSCTTPFLYIQWSCTICRSFSIK